jgi:hypothetical protein
MTSRRAIPDGNIKDLAQMMVDVHGPDAETEAARRAANCRDRGDVATCEAWWRMEAEIREILKAMPTGKVN